MDAFIQDIKTKGLLKQLKQDFDPLNIFNPHKKTDTAWDYTMAHIRHHFLVFSRGIYPDWLLAEYIYSSGS